MKFLSHLAAIYWDPNPDIFRIPYLNHPLKWYGLLFMGGIVAGFLLLLPLVRQKLFPTRGPQAKELAYHYVDGLMWWIVLGTIIGARLGHVFFYDWGRYHDHWLDIFKVWEGGLASHGGTLGVLAAVYGYTLWTRHTFPEIRFLTLTDLISIPTAFAVIFIRLGNFINQEILGTVTSLPWGVVFGHPADGSFPMPRHPVQLYEAIAYLLTFFLLAILWWHKDGRWPTGFITGILFVSIFGSRFFLEFFKAPLESTLNETYLQAGQILSLPFIFLGVALICYSQLRSRHDIADKQAKS